MKKITIILTLLWSTLTYAEPPYNFEMYQQPLICGGSVEIDRYVEDNKFTPITASVGRLGSNPEGEIVYFLTYYINERYETLAVAQIPNDDTRCILFHTFNMKMNNKLTGTDT